MVTYGRRVPQFVTRFATKIFSQPKQESGSSSYTQTANFHGALVSIRIHCQPVNSLLVTPEFEQWLGNMRDAKGKARILSRMDSAALGNFGDCQPVGEGVSEMRIHFGPGYRVYFMRRGSSVYVLLIGGDKSTQKRDIRRAQKMARELKI